MSFLFFFCYLSSLYESDNTRYDSDSLDQDLKSKSPIKSSPNKEKSSSSITYSCFRVPGLCGDNILQSGLSAIRGSEIFRW